MNQINKEKLKLLKNIREVKGDEPVEKMVELLKKLQEVAPKGLKIYEKLIYFVSDVDRKKYCDFFGEPLEPYGLLNMMTNIVLKECSTVFMCCNREPRANKYAQVYKDAETEEELKLSSNIKITCLICTRT